MAIVVLVKDLFFKAKILETARHAKTEIVFADSIEKAGNAPLLLVDLEDFGVKGISAFRQKNPDSGVIGFLSHINLELRKKAQIEGCVVLSRSEFTNKLFELLKTHG